MCWCLQVGTLNPEKAIPGVVLGGARGLALLTTVKAGAGVSYKLGSGLVLSRRTDGRWSAPTAIATAGFGWGAQVRLGSLSSGCFHRGCCCWFVGCCLL